MKLLTSLLFIFALAGTYTASAQNSTYNTTISLGQDSLYKADYSKFKELYIKKLDSEAHYKVLVLGKEFVEKMNHPQKLNALMYVNDPLVYIKENLSTTSFKSYEAAVEEWEALSVATRDEWKINKEYYDLEKIIRKIWSVKMVTDVTEEIAREYPEKFDLLEKPRKPE